MDYTLNRANVKKMKRAGEMATSNLCTEAMATTSDLSILRKPIKTSVTGFNEARKAYEDGTEEVKRLLSNECDIIYECKVCRNMFRSLVNFISHKRVYCQNQFNAAIDFGFGNDGLLSQDLTTIVQAENDYIQTTNSKHQDKDLGSIIERLVKREQTNRLMKLNDFYEQVNKKLTQDEVVQKKHMIQLDHVPESNAAVYQTVKVDNNGDMKTEIDEVHELLMSDKNVLGPDGKIVNLSELPIFNSNLMQHFECDVCNSRFSTEKTLKLHIEAKHVPSTFVYQCPSCNKTFLRASAVIRHLTNDHKKSLRRIRLMRESIHKRRTRLDEVQVKGPSRELTRLQTDKERVDAQNKAWLDNLENPENSSICTYCGKRFERRAVLISHIKVCRNKVKPRNTLLKKKVLEKEAATTNWNRDYDDSSNSNSFDAFFAADESIKTETMDVETNDSANINKRKRKRALKAINIDSPMDLDDEKALNDCWNSDVINGACDTPINSSPVAELDAQVKSVATSTRSNHTTEAIKNANKIEESLAEIKKEDVKKDETKKVMVKLYDGKSNRSSNCRFCDKTFSNASNLRRHISMLHNLQRRYGCALCENYSALRKVDVYQHFSAEHSVYEKSEAIKFICVKEEEIVPRSLSSSRRKDKHTEVLKDEVESTVVTADIKEEAPTSLDTSNDNSNIDLDLGNVSDNSLSMSQSGNQSANGTSDSIVVSGVKRKGRPKGTFKDAMKIVERSQSVGEPNTSSQSRRPVRNRIMPVKKDFVYDLSTLLKKEVAAFRDQQQSPQFTPISTPSSSPPLVVIKPTVKRCNTVDERIENDPLNCTEEEEPREKSPEPIKINGTAHAMALEAVNENRAVFYKPPEFPTERPISAPIKITPQRPVDSNSIKDWRVLKKPNQIVRSRKSEDAKSETIALKRKHSSGKLKRLSEKTSLKFKSSESSITKMNGKNATSSPLKTYQNHKAKNLPTKIESTKSISLDGSEVSESDSEQKGMKTQSAPSTPTRRMTLMERMAENKTKKLNESMAKMSIGKTGGPID